VVDELDVELHKLNEVLEHVKFDTSEKIKYKNLLVDAYQMMADPFETEFSGEIKYE
jgi:hypothetical protein